jgi:hypothetical protein
MLDYRKLPLSYYEAKLSKKEPLHRRNFLEVYFSIKDPIAYMAFLIFFIYDDNRNYRLALLRQCESQELSLDYNKSLRVHAEIVPKRHEDLKGHLRYLITVAEELQNVAKEFGEIKQGDFVEAWRLIDIFNNADYMIREYGGDISRTLREHSFGDKADLPVPRFAKCVWLYQCLDFVRHFQKLRYPLVVDWLEFIRFPLELYKAVPKTLSFGDYVLAVRNGDFESWYRRCKVGLPKHQESEDWQERYEIQLRKMNHGQLSRELQRHGWGHRMVKDEIIRRTQIRISF